MNKLLVMGGGGSRFQEYDTSASDKRAEYFKNKRAEALIREESAYRKARDVVADDKYDAAQAIAKTERDYVTSQREKIVADEALKTSILSSLPKNTALEGYNTEIASKYDEFLNKRLTSGMDMNVAEAAANKDLLGAWGGRKGYDDEQAYLSADSLNRSADSVVLDGQDYARRARQAGIDKGLNLSDADALFKSTSALYPKAKDDSSKYKDYIKAKRDDVKARYKTEETAYNKMFKDSDNKRSTTKKYKNNKSGETELIKMIGKDFPDTDRTFGARWTGDLGGENLINTASKLLQERDEKGYKRYDINDIKNAMYLASDGTGDGAEVDEDKFTEALAGLEANRKYRKKNGITDGKMSDADYAKYMKSIIANRDAELSKLSNMMLPGAGSSKKVTERDMINRALDQTFGKSTKAKNDNTSGNTGGKKKSTSDTKHTAKINANQETYVPDEVVGQYTAPAVDKRAENNIIAKVNNSSGGIGGNRFDPTAGPMVQSSEENYLNDILTAQMNAGAKKNIDNTLIQNRLNNIAKKNPHITIQESYAELVNSGTMSKNAIKNKLVSLGYSFEDAMSIVFRNK